MDFKSGIRLKVFERGEDIAFAIMRIFVGVFLVLETWDNVESSERMQEFIEFVAVNGFPMPEVLAPLSVWAQFICGIFLILGLFTRVAALLMVFNFIVAFLMVHLSHPLRAQFPALILILVNGCILTRGGRRFALDSVLLKELGVLSGD